MRAYRISVEGDPDKVRFEANVRDAHRFVKNQWRAFMDQAFIDFVDIPTDKDNVMLLLNGAALPQLRILRSWTFTSRGGLHEVEL